MKKIVFGIYIILSFLLSLIILAGINLTVSKEFRSKKFTDIFLRRFVGICLKILNVKINIHGEIDNYENIENSLIVANHQSLFDMFLMLNLFKATPVFISKKENAKIPILNLWMKELDVITLDRTNVRESIQKINAASEVLKQNGKNVIIFPQGTRNNNDVDFKPGSLKIASKASADILPIAIKGSSKILSGFFYTKAYVDIYVLQPLLYQEYKSENLVDIQEDIQEKIFEKVKNQNNEEKK